MLVVCVADSSGNWDFDLVASGNLTGSATSTEQERYCDFSTGVFNYSVLC